MSVPPTIDVRTDPSPWHQLLVLDQDFINNAFKNMWIGALQESPLRQVDITTRGNGQLKGYLEPPVVTINVEDHHTYQLWYTMRFAAGSLTVFNSNDPRDQSQSTCNVMNWSFVFPVMLTLETLDSETDEYKTVVNNHTFTTNPKAIFSLSKLYIDSSDAVSWDQKKSDFKDTNFLALPLGAQANFFSLINDHIVNARVEGQTLLGYNLQTTDPGTVNAVAPTFPPTLIDYYTYPYLESPDSAPKNGSGVNALCYLMMTDEAPLPAEPVLRATGDWVTSAPNAGSALCINRDQFFGRWFLPLAKKLNIATSIQCTQPYINVVANGMTFGPPGWSMGTNENHSSNLDTYWDFTLQGNSYVWNGDTTTKGNEDRSGNDGFWLKLVATETAQASTTVTWTPQSPNITIAGNTWFKVHLDQTGIASGPCETVSNASINMNWSVRYKVSEVNDGGVQITPFPDPQTYITMTPSTSNDDKIRWDIPWSTYSDRITASLENAIRYALISAEQSLMDGLAGQEKLFLPGAGTFTMHTPLFNTRGDFTVRMFYNGSKAPGVEPALPDWVKALPARIPLPELKPRPTLNVNGHSQNGEPTKVPVVKVNPVGKCTEQSSLRPHKDTQFEPVSSPLC